MRWTKTLGTKYNVFRNWFDFVGISDYAEIVEDEGDYSSPDGKYFIFVTMVTSKKQNAVDTKYIFFSLLLPKCIWWNIISDKIRDKCYGTLVFVLQAKNNINFWYMYTFYASNRSLELDEKKKWNDCQSL